MKKNSEQAKFFCESCGKEVKQNAKVCTYCGKFFSSVRCPKCGKTGTTSEFENGCPDCGYAVNKNFKNINSSSKGNINSKSGQSGFFNSIMRAAEKRSAKQQNSDSLPLWMYLVCIVTLIVIIILFYGCLK